LRLKYNSTKIVNFENLVIFLLLFFIIITNNYFGENEINASARSSEYYLKIAAAFPDVAKFSDDSQTYIHGERFLVSYFIGFLSTIFNIEIFSLFRILSYSFIVYIIFLNFKIINLLITKSNSKIIFFSLVILNPYIIRYFLSNPIMLNDLIFILSISLLFLSFIKTKDYIFYISIILAVISRQTSLVILLALFIYLILPLSKDFINYKKFFLSLLIYLINYFISKYYLNIANLNDFYDSNIFGLINYFKNSEDYLALLNFLILPILSFGPLLIFLFIKLTKYELKIKFDKKYFFFVIVLLGIVAQPIIAGPLVTGKNIIRLSSLGYYVSIFLFCAHLKNFEISSRKFKIIFISFLILWSLHPTFSKVNIFDGLKQFIIFN